MNSYKNIVSIGEHGSILCSEFSLDISNLKYERGNIFKNQKARIHVNGNIHESDNDFSRNSLCEQIIEGLKANSVSLTRKIAMGDPSELFTQAAIHAFIKLNSLSAVILLYPAAMTALDIRKEIAELIYFLNNNQIPTYLIRDPKLFYSAFEPNMRAFVYSLAKEIHPTKGLTYLCGAKNFETTTV